MKVFISTTTFAEYSKEPLELLKGNKISFSVNPYKRKLSEKEIAGFFKKDLFDGLIAGTEPITNSVLDIAHSLKVISRVGVGLDNIDLKAAKARKIEVFNTPDVLTDAVAELTIGLILSALRNIPTLDRNIRNQNWTKLMGFLFKDKMLGLIGFGKIGQRVAVLAKSFGVKPVFYDLRDIKSDIASQVSFDELIKTSDIISLHVSTKEELISDREIKMMKDNIVLVNTSRGTALNEKALYKGLKSRKIFFAALDVFNNEPYFGRLKDLDNVILTPHIGSYAKESRIEMELEAVKNLLKGLNKK